MSHQREASFNSDPLLVASTLGEVDLHRLLPEGELLMAGVSGGLDSMVLLHWLARGHRERLDRLVVAHFNHHLRGKASDDDEAFVREEASRLGVRCVTERSLIGNKMSSSGLSMEMAAREERRDFFRRTCAGQGIRRVVLAHHRDDQVELFFLRLLRGASGEGLSGMSAEKALSRNPEILLVRPFLRLGRRELESYAKKESIRFREDSTNLDDQIPRNRVRRKLLPLIREEFQPALETVIERDMELIRGDSDCVRLLSEKWLATKANKELFKELHPAMQRYVLRLQLETLGIGWNYQRIEWLRLHADRRLSVAPDQLVIRDSSGILRHQEPAPDVFQPCSSILDLTLPRGRITIMDHLLSWEVSPYNPSEGLPGSGHEELFFDADRVGQQVIIRHWLPGDRFQPIGMHTPVKLQDLLVNLKIPKEDRHRLLLGQTVKGEIFWIQGLRMAELFKLDRISQRQLKWSCKVR